MTKNGIWNLNKELIDNNGNVSTDDNATNNIIWKTYQKLYLYFSVVGLVV